jgi:hypothetical protein
MVPALLAAADNKACKLLTPAELEPVVGSKLSTFQGQSIGTTDMCSATSTSAKVLLRLAQKRAGSADAAAKGLEIAKKMRATVDVKTFGPIVCSTFIPPKGKEMAGYNTTCTVSKGDNVAGVEVTVKAQKDMVSIDKLHPLADRMAGRI